MHADSIYRTFSSRLYTQGRTSNSVAVKINQGDPQTALVTITDHMDASEPFDHLFKLLQIDDLSAGNLIDSGIHAYRDKIISDEHVVRELAPHAGMDCTDCPDE